MNWQTGFALGFLWALCGGVGACLLDLMDIEIPPLGVAGSVAGIFFGPVTLIVALIERIGIATKKRITR